MLWWAGDATSGARPSNVAGGREQRIRGGGGVTSRNARR